jgi:hypothetical protein
VRTLRDDLEALSHHDLVELAANLAEAMHRATALLDMYATHSGAAKNASHILHTALLENSVAMAEAVSE